MTPAVRHPPGFPGGVNQGQNPPGSMAGELRKMLTVASRTCIQPGNLMGGGVFTLTARRVRFEMPAAGMVGWP
jgi:hypothetical protein